MPNRRLPTRKIKEALRLKYDCGISEREYREAAGELLDKVVDELRMKQINPTGELQKDLGLLEKAVADRMSMPRINLLVR